MTQRRAGRFATVSVLITTSTAAAAIVVALWSGGALNRLICGGDCGSDAVAAPSALAVDPMAGDISTRLAPARALDPAAIDAAVAGALADDHLGDRVGFAAVDPRSGRVVSSSAKGRAFIPASTTKVLTALTVLSTLDPQERFSTSVVRSGDELILVGGGDPYLASEPARPKRLAVAADITTLAARTARALRQAGLSRVRLDFNATRFTGPAMNPAWEDSYLTEKVVTPISALWVDRGLVAGVRSDDPARSAAAAFADKLRDAGIDVSSQPQSVPVPPDATRVATVPSATVAEITEQMIASSDNEAAEVLLRQAALATGRQASFVGGVAAMTEVVRAAGIQTPGLVVDDGSGLSRHDRIAPETLAQALARSAADPRSSSLVADLPVAGFSGSLSRRFGEATDGRGLVRAKTGTLKGVHSLAGYVTDRRGAAIVFAVMADHAEDISSVEVEAALDGVAAALATCACSVGP